MRLSALSIKNFKSIGADPLTVLIDDIVILIGPNNCGKSTVLDAYEAFASTGSARDIDDFHNNDPSLPVEISGIFSALTDEDIDTIGAAWRHDDPELGSIVKVKYEWRHPGEKGEKYTWSPEKEGWVRGGSGGWDSLFTSRIPAPLRVRPTDKFADTEQQIVKILADTVKESVKVDQTRTAEILEKLNNLARELSEEIKELLDQTCNTASERLGSVFFGYELEFCPAADKLDAEKIITAGTHLRVSDPKRNNTLPLANQGAGLQRAFLWSALSALAEAGRVKHGRKNLDAGHPRVLLIDEPEAFLHPPTVRAAREALYEVAQVEGWQVMATTHSAVFIDVSKPHTTLVRIASDPTEGSLTFQSTENMFSGSERDQLRMVRNCHPTVNEFFFVDHVLLVEGETEHAVLSFLLERQGPRAKTLHIVNCMGKSNLLLFAKILNQFGARYTILHDSDSRFAQRTGNWIKNPAWTTNESLVNLCADQPKASLCCHIPDFEGHYFQTKLERDKPYSAVQQLARTDFDTADEFASLRTLLDDLVEGTHGGAWTTLDELDRLVDAWVAEHSPDESGPWTGRA